MGALEQQKGDSPVPIIDFGHFRHAASPEEKKKTAKAIFDAFRTVGFVYLVNHGIPLSTIHECLQWSDKFFSLPVETKMKCPHPPSGAHHRGYSALGREKVVMEFDKEKIANSNKPPDVKESFDIGREDDPDCPNVWPVPEDLPGFREFCMSYFWTCRQTEIDILHAIALGMDLDETYFDSFHTDANNQLRLLYYPSIEEKVLRTGERERLPVHTDFCTMTMLVQDECGGLEVEEPNKPGVFKPAPPVPGAIVVNIGDFLMRWSNDILKSTLHRVRAPPGQATTNQNGAAISVKMTRPRYSIPYFCAADKTATIDCIPGCWGEGRPKKYEPINSAEYIDMRLNLTY